MRKQKHVEILTDGIFYKYHSAEWDDLNEVCEENLRNWEPKSRKIFRLLSKEVSTIVDVGAYTGIYSIESSISNSHARVIAFEPNPVAAEAFINNVDINNISNIELFISALGSQQGNEDLYTTSSNFGSSTSSLIPTNSLDMRLSVKVDAADRLLSFLSIGLIKIDVEGFEKYILKGFISIVSRDNPVILTEALTEKELHDQADILRPIGYCPPIRAGSSDGDERNFFWVPPMNELAIKTITQIAEA